MPVVLLTDPAGRAALDRRGVHPGPAATLRPMTAAVQIATLQRERDEARGAMYALISELNRIRLECLVLADQWAAENPGCGHAEVLRAALNPPDAPGGA